jgi:ABC-type polysaccharide/polyol phosphate transport system ATPase subunit
MFQDVSVKYRLIRERRRSLQEYLIRYIKGKRLEAESFSALQSISFAVKKGDSLGIIGHNGAGKSTLLKVISGVIKCNNGGISVNGKVAPLIELEAGFDHELTGRENIYLNASMLGFSKKDINESFDSIVEFSELRNFINTPLKNFSSGMVARLSFSIATAVKPDVLLIDEMFAVGDAHFNEKSRERILEFNRKGVTIIFVSHKMEEIRNICSTVLWLDHGRIKKTGRPEDVINEYEQYMRHTTL